MPGGRKTHDYPFGIPTPLKVLNLLAMLSFVGIALAMPRDWHLLVVMATWFVTFAFISSRLHRKYERTGEAVRLRRSIGVTFVDGIPGPICAIRVAFFVLVAVMLVFGMVRLSSEAAHRGIVASVFALIAVGVIYLFAERHYVKTGRAVETFKE